MLSSLPPSSSPSSLALEWHSEHDPGLSPDKGGNGLTGLDPLSDKEPRSASSACAMERVQKVLYWDMPFFVCVPIQKNDVPIQKSVSQYEMDTLYCRAAAVPWIHDRRGRRRVRPSGLGAWAHIRARWLMNIHFLLLAGVR